MGKYKLKKDWTQYLNWAKLGAIVEGTPSGANLNITQPDKRTMSLSDFEKVDDSSTPVTTFIKDTSSTQVAAANSSENTLVIASSVGALAGLGFAFYRKSSVGGYIGYFILGSIVGSLIAHVIKPKTSTEN